MNARLLFVGFVYVCGCVTAKNYDKQIRLAFSESVFAVSSQGAREMVTSESQQLIKFDKRNYIGVHKITYCPNVAASDSALEGYVELYNITDKQPVLKSRIRVVGTAFEYIESENLYEYLPEKEITLGIRLLIKDKSPNRYISSAGKAYLFLYRK
jgi:hypothetical protein